MKKIHVEGLSFAYNGVPALEDILLEIEQGELLALVGPNGSGKSTLLKLIAGVLRAKHGVVYLDLQEITKLPPREIARRLAALEQERHVGFDFTVREIVEWGRHPHRGRLAPWTERDERAVQNALTLMGLEALSGRLISELSGGERQRVFLAMALAQEPEVLLLDEPTAHLDLKYQLELLELIRRLVDDDGLTVVAALHDLNWAARYADRVAVLSQGRLVACGPPPEIFTPELIRKVWKVTVQVIESPGGLWICPQTVDHDTIEHSHEDCIAAAERCGDRLRAGTPR